MSDMETILATSNKRYSYKFSKTTWKKIPQRHLLKPGKKWNLQSFTGSNYKHHNIVEFILCVVPNSTLSLSKFYT